MKQLLKQDFFRRSITSSTCPSTSKGPHPEKPRRVEVVVTQGADGSREVLLQDLSFGAGVGWYVQKTIRLDPDQVNALLRALCCARQPCFEGKGSSSPEKNSTGGAQILDFGLLA